MGPRIKRSIVEGFRATNRSWLGIGFFAAGLLAVTVAAIGLVMVTNPPPELFEQPTGPGAAAPASGLMEVAFAEQPESPASPEEPAAQPEEPPAAAEPELAPAGESEATLFNQLEEAGDVLLPAPDAAASAAAADDEARSRVIGQWFGRAWPALLIALLLALAGNVWLNGGQIGYLAKQMTAPPARVSEFWVAGSRAFVPLIGAWALSLLGIAGAVAVLALIGVVLAALPEAARAVLGALIGLGFLAGFVWLIVRLAFWFIVVVVERAGPVAALKASFRVSRGRWWRLVGLGLLTALISYAAWVPFGLLEWVGTLIGGGAAVALGLVGNVGGIVVSLYVGFVALAAYLRFYEDAKSAPAGPGPSAP
jgi:hypothetical protein